MLAARPAEDRPALVLSEHTASGVVEARVTDPYEAFERIGCTRVAADLAIEAGLVEIPTDGPVRWYTRQG